MLLICDVVGLNDEQLHHIKQTFPEHTVSTPQIPNTATDVYEKLAYCSLCIEHCVLPSSEFVSNAKYTSILVIFDNYINDIDNLYLHVHNMRTDELIFPSRSPAYKAGWFAGHPLAVIKMLSGILELKRYTWPNPVNVGWGDPFVNTNATYTNGIMHWANRIRMKVGTLE